MRSAVIAAGRRYPALRLAPQPGHERAVRLGPLVLESAPLNPPTPTADTDRTVSRRSEPSSCTTLTGEQPDPWDLLQPQDVISRHRGAKPRRRCELSGAISLLSPAYLLSVAREPLHPGLPDHYGPLSWRFEMSLSPSGWLLPLHSRSASTDRAEPTLRAPPLLFRRRPPQSNCPHATVTEKGWPPWGRHRTSQGGISLVPPPELAPGAQRLP